MPRTSAPRLKIFECQFCHRWIALRANTISGRRKEARAHQWQASEALGMMLTCPTCAKHNMTKKKLEYRNTRGRIWDAFKELDRRGVHVQSSWAKWKDGPKDCARGHRHMARPAHLNPWNANGELLKPLRIEVGSCQEHIVAIQNTFVDHGLTVVAVTGNNIWIQ